MPLYFKFMLGGWVAYIAGITFFTTLSIAPVGPNGRADLITLFIAGFHLLMGSLLGLTVYFVVRSLARNS